jgi:hypothetical protein
MSNDSVDYGPVIADLEAKIAAMQATLNGLRAAAGLAVETTHAATAPHAGHGAHPPAVIKPDTFFRKTVVESVMIYLKMMKSPQTTRQIVDSLERGGCKTSTSTASSLMSRRAAAEGDITKVTNNTWGLSEWYGGSTRKKRPSKSESEETPASTTETKG